MGLELNDKPKNKILKKYKSEFKKIRLEVGNETKIKVKTIKNNKKNKKTKEISKTETTSKIFEY